MSLARHLWPGLLLAFCVVLLWQVAGENHHLPRTVPAPSVIAAAFAQWRGALLQNAIPTLLVTFGGLATASVVALTLAACAAIVPRIETPLVSLGIIVDSVPLIAMTPILMVVFGVGLGARIVIATLACALPILLGAIRGLRGAATEENELFHVLAASRLTRLRLLALPSALPFLLSAYKIAAPAALLGALVSEWAGAERGLGVEMTYAMFAFDVPQLWMAIVATCALALLLYGAFALIERAVVA